MSGTSRSSSDGDVYRDVAGQLVHAFNCRSGRSSLFHVGVTTNHALIWAVVASLALQVGILTIPIMEPIFKVAPFRLKVGN
ncbi:MAG: cation transporting ATPase C-terminal domain-containing protein [Nitrospira sp.]